jgi:hypothetical protein
MDIENQETEVVDQQVVENAAQDVAEEEVDTSAEPDATGVPSEEVAEEYAPKFKYKVRDEEHEMEEWVRDYIKDEETEKKFVELYTRQHGLELAKTEREQYKGRFEDLESAVLDVSRLANEGQIGKFIDTLGLPKKAFIEYAINELKYQELPEEQRREIDAQRQREAQTEQQSMQLTEMQRAYQDQEVNLRRMELDMTLRQPEYAEAEKMYDESVGTPGSFRNFIAVCGNYHWETHGKDIGVEGAIAEAMRLGRVQAGAAPTQTGNVGTQEKPVQQDEKPVIPNFKSGGASPAKKGFTSVQQIREYNANRR